MTSGFNGISKNEIDAFAKTWRDDNDITCSKVQTPMVEHVQKAETHEGVM